MPDVNHPQKILITGSDGAIGKAATLALKAAGHFVRGLDLRPSRAADESVVGSITDASLVHKSAEGMNAVIHLAATVDDADFMTQLLPNNIVGLYNILEAARIAGVPRICLASTMQVVSRARPKDGVILRIEDGPGPCNHYAATKLFAEDMGLLYANRYQMQVICPRIGWFPRNAAEAQRIVKNNAQHVYLSHADAGRFFVRFVEADNIRGPQEGYAIVFLVSRRTREKGQDLEPARTAIGYEPQDTFPDGLPLEF